VPKILLFIPMYNCEKQIVRVLEQLNEDVTEFIDEVIIVNNRSTDRSEQAIIDHLNAKAPVIPVKLLRNNENYNLGGSHKVAFQYALENGFDYTVVLHGDDQGRILDFQPLFQSGQYCDYDCCYGARFMKDSQIFGYSKLRIFGNHVFNAIFTIVTGKRIYDLGSGLNLFKMEPLRDGYYLKFPDTLYFNNCMILALMRMKQNVLFYPISWREEDQVSNNKLVSFSISLLKMIFNYLRNKEKFLQSEMRTKIIDQYIAQVVSSWNPDERLKEV